MRLCDLCAKHPEEVTGVLKVRRRDSGRGCGQGGMRGRNRGCGWGLVDRDGVHARRDHKSSSDIRKRHQGDEGGGTKL